MSAIDADETRADFDAVPISPWTTTSCKSMLRCLTIYLSFSKHLELSVQVFNVFLGSR